MNVSDEAGRDRIHRSCFWSSIQLKIQIQVWIFWALNRYRYKQWHCIPHLLCMQSHISDQTNHWMPILACFFKNKLISKMITDTRLIELHFSLSEWSRIYGSIYVDCIGWHRSTWMDMFIIKNLQVNGTKCSFVHVHNISLSLTFFFNWAELQEQCKL